MQIDAIRRLGTALALGTLLALAGSASAQEEIDATPDAPEEEVVEEEAPSARVPDSEKASISRTALERMREILSKVLEHLSDAREDRDVVKLNCVNEKLTAVKGLLKISEQADVTLQEALATRDPEVAAHEFDKIRLALSKCEQLSAESEACVGELAVYAGETEIEVIAPDDDGTPTKEVDMTEYVTRPAAASPFQ